MPGVPLLTLNNGVEIPQLGFGTYKIGPDATVDTTLVAFEVGYRHVDTAEMYGNERQVGEAVRRSGLDRSEIFVTSKLEDGAHAPDGFEPLSPLHVAHSVSGLTEWLLGNA